MSHALCQWPFEHARPTERTFGGFGECRHTLAQSFPRMAAYEKTAARPQGKQSWAGQGSAGIGIDRCDGLPEPSRLFEEGRGRSMLASIRRVSKTLDSRRGSGRAKS